MNYTYDYQSNKETGRNYNIAIKEPSFSAGALLIVQSVRSKPLSVIQLGYTERSFKKLLSKNTLHYSIAYAISKLKYYEHLCLMVLI